MAPSCVLVATLVSLVTTFAPVTLATDPPQSANYTPFVLFSDGDVDDHNRTWGCVRGSSLVRTPNGSLLAFFSGMLSCADGSPQSSLMMRSSTNNGTTSTGRSCSSSTSCMIRPGCA